ncbi:uncharacterized protein [Triticum aestivum]|uniref:uncharacterized protein isoform X4 n=1 Tax=Triticum aestivum TaxID=4565 RepID=UPI001D008DAA|nr:uncharacterized protein LOC123133378 isoform X4 [Triticum aestivum]
MDDAAPALLRCHQAVAATRCRDEGEEESCFPRVHPLSRNDTQPQARDACVGGSRSTSFSTHVRHPPWMMTTTRASTATTTPRTWSNSATTSSTARLRPRSCSASTTTSSSDLWFIILTACHLCHRRPVSRTIGTTPPPSLLML